MPAELTCPGCGHHLQVRSDVRLQWLTCPRCLAMVTNPLVTGVTAERSVAELAASESPASLTCYACGKPVERGFQVCPYCTAVLKKSAVRTLRAADVDAGTDLSMVGCGLILLGLLGGLGVMIALLSGGLGQVFQNGETAVLVWIVLLALPAVGIGLAASSRKPGRGVMAGITGGMTIVLVALGIPLAFVFALFIAILTACSSCGRPPGH